MAAAPGPDTAAVPPMTTGTRADFPPGTISASVEVKLSAKEAGKSTTYDDVKYCKAKLVARDGTIVSAPQCVEHIWSSNAKITVSFDKVPKEVRVIFLGVFAPERRLLSEIGVINCRVHDVTNIPGTLCTTQLATTLMENAASAVMIAFYRGEAAHTWSMHVVGRRFAEHDDVAVGILARTMATDYPTAWVVVSHIPTSGSVPSAAAPLAGPPLATVMPTDEEAAKRLAYGINSPFVTAGISWESNWHDFDLHAVYTSDRWLPLDIISYNKPRDDIGAARHSGDVQRGVSEFRAGAGCGFDEQITFNLNKIAENDGSLYVNKVYNVYLIVVGHNGDIPPDAGLSFSLVEGTDATGVERLRYDFNQGMERVGGFIVTRFCVGRDTRNHDLAQILPWEPTAFCGNDFLGALCVLNQGRLFGEPTPLPSVPVAAPVSPTWDPMKRAPADRVPRVNNAAIAPGMSVRSEPMSMKTVDVARQDKLFVHVYGAVGVLPGDHLHSMDWDKRPTSDPYVVITLVGGNKHQKGQTEVIKKTTWPFWNTSFRIPGPFTAEGILNFDVFDKDMIGHKLLGSTAIRLSDVWCCDGIQTFRLGGKAFKDQTPTGLLFARFCWDEPEFPIDEIGVHKKSPFNY